MDIYHFWPALFVALVAAAAGLFVPGGWGRAVRPVAARPWRGAAVVAGLSVAVDLFTCGHRGLPRPHVNDEYGYLLIADTFLHGRLTNPTPADPDAFASPHVLLTPTYTAKYPPGQGLVLAVGRLIGRPVFGVWLSAAAAAVACYWAVSAFAPPAWALLGGLVAAASPMSADWSYVFWGGDLAVLGGALAVGGWGRLARVPSAAGPPSGEPLAAGLLGVGLVTLAFSRPYEGFVFSLPLAASLALSGRLWRVRTAGPLLSVLAVGGLAVLRYDAAVTGDPFRLPIAAYAADRDVAPKFWFLPERSPPPVYPNGTLRWIHAGFEDGEWRLWRTPAGVAWQSVSRAVRFVMTFARPGLLLVPLGFAAVATARRSDADRRRLAWLWATVGVTVLGLWAETFYLEHYAAPLAAALLVLTVVGWRHLHARSPGLARAVAVGFVAGAGWSIWAVGAESSDVSQDAAAALLPALATGRHLLFVEYTADHFPHDELVYNGADPATQRLLWAHSRGPAADHAVVRDYPGRRTWLLTVGGTEIDPRPYNP